MTTAPKSFHAAGLALCLLAIALPCLPLFAQGDAGLPVREIEIQYVGPASISKERILANMKTAVGKPYSETAVEQDIRTLFGTKEVSNVRIFSEPAGDAVRVVVVVETRATVSEVLLEGVSSVKAGRLRKEVETKPGSTLSDLAVEQDRQKILDYYQQRGFGDVKVSATVTPDTGKGTARVTFTIDEGGKGVVKSITFAGNNAFTTKVLRGKMKTKPKNIFSFINKSGRLEDDQLNTDVAAIEEFYRENGYIDAKVTNVRRERAGPDRIDLVLEITEGDKYSLGKLVFTGNKLFTTDELRAVLKMPEGAVFSPGGLRRDTKAVRDLYGAKGYVDLLVLPETTPGGPAVVNLSYKIDEGYQSYVERINIEGNTKTKDKVLRRELAIYPGEIFDTTKVESSKARLENLGYFSRVEAYPSDTLIPGRKDLNVVVEEKRTGSFNFGAGFSSIDNLIGFAELTQGNFDITKWPSFTGAGQKFRVRAQYGTERTDFILAITEPWFLDRQLALGGELFYREATYLSDVYDQRNAGGAINLRKPINEFTFMRFEYSLQDIEIYNVDDGATEDITSQEGTQLKSQLSGLLVWDTRDSVFLTRKGHRVDFNIYGAGGPLGGDEDIYGFGLEVSKYWSLPYDMIFLLNGEIGVVDTWSGGDDVPIWDRLYLGGANNLRGFDFREVGPKDANGEPIGGRTLTRLTAELTVPIINRVRGAVFYDIGFVAADAYKFDGSDTGSDIGLGLRLDLPIGPVRIDFGYPLQSDQFNDSNGKFNFNVGYQF